MAANQRITRPALVSLASTLGSTLVVGPGAATCSAIEWKVHSATYPRTPTPRFPEIDRG